MAPALLIARGSQGTQNVFYEIGCSTRDEVCGVNSIGWWRGVIPGDSWQTGTNPPFEVSKLGKSAEVLHGLPCNWLEGCEGLAGLG